jgi:ankyrin repeat protein
MLAAMKAVEPGSGPGTELPRSSTLVVDGLRPCGGGGSTTALSEALSSESDGTKLAARALVEEGGADVLAGAVIHAHGSSALPGPVLVGNTPLHALAAATPPTSSLRESDSEFMCARADEIEAEYAAVAAAMLDAVPRSRSVPGTSVPAALATRTYVTGTPLHAAARHNNAAFFEALDAWAAAQPPGADFGVNWDVTSTVPLGVGDQHGSGRTPLQEAADEGCTEAAVALLRHGADPNAAEPGTLAPLLLALQLQSQYSWRMSSNAAGYIKTAEHADAIAAALVRAGADTRVRDDEGRTPMHGACDRHMRGAVAALLAAGQGWSLLDTGAGSAAGSDSSGGGSGGAATAAGPAAGGAGVCVRLSSPLALARNRRDGWNNVMAAEIAAFGAWLREHGLPDAAWERRGPLVLARAALRKQQDAEWAAAEAAEATAAAGAADGRKD